jgi:hypothetical protein
LRRARPQIEATIAADQHKIALWRTTESAQLASRIAAIKADRDFLSRQAALDRVERANPVVRKYVLFFLAFLITLDLVAILLKVIHLFSTGAAYERSAAALRSTDLVEVHRLQERATVTTRRISLESRAEERADSLRFGSDVAPPTEAVAEPGPEQRTAVDSSRPPLGGPATVGQIGT